MKSHQYVLGSHSTIASLELGEAKTAAKTVVFVHGWMDNSESFTGVMKALNRIDPTLHLVAIDLPGHGLSTDKGADNFYPFHDYIDDLHGVLQNFSAKETILIGHSLGALITSCYSAAFPEKVTALVEIEGYGPLSESSENSTQRLRTGVLSRYRYREKKPKGLSDPEDAVRIRSINTQVAQALIRPMTYRALEQKNGQWYWRHDEKLKCDSLYRMSEQQRNDIINNIECPHLIILGESGFASLKAPYLLKKGEKDEKGSQPFEKWVSIPGGHHCHLEHPEKVSALIMDLVNKI
ncbi:alpha/beta hydrolase [Vibrio sp. vnigr-6D03]|uniref:alpha/beta fold hydrolase n=1 Tax=Vibrio sp. vnigr-6D03 TaxID=2058088 RepID=UPI000C32E064|nr:alpha/beta hydrolase [Vibrio sp. vnigr-6D03]PKF78324.1 alpha/beta hydrolase [Vibrio sp. vnigr-6D03]